MRRDIYGGKAPEDLGAYTLGRAAALVRMPAPTLRLWVGKGGLVRLASRTPPLLSFSNLIETFVLASMRRVHGIPMQRVRRALDYVGEELGYERPLLHARFRTDGVRLFVDHAGSFLDVSARGQAALKDVLSASLDRIDWADDVATRLYPWVRGEPSRGQPKTIVVDPRRSFGKPVLAGTGVEALIVAQRYRAGESVMELARDYGVEVEKIEDAIRCETRDAA